MPRVIIKPHIVKENKIITSEQGINMRTSKKTFRAIIPPDCDNKTFLVRGKDVKGKENWLEFDQKIFQILKE